MSVPETMTAVLFTSDGEVRADRVSVADPGPGEVLIRVAAVGICGTDLHLLRGDHVARDGDLVPGHEFSGRVAAIGPDVAGLAEGDLVAADPNIPCRACAPCQRGRSNLCENYEAVGVTRAGAAAEYVVVPAACCVVLSAGTEGRALEDLALAEPLSCAVRGVDVVSPDLADAVLIYGAGTMGMMMAELLARSGASSVAVVDPNLAKLEHVRAVGASAVAASVPELPGARQEWDVVVDCTGVPAAIADGLDRVGRGGTFLQFGVAATQATVEISPHRIYRDEISIVGSMAVLNSYSRAVSLMESAVVSAEPYVSHRLPLESYAEAIELFAAGATRKVLLTPGA